MAYTRGPAHPWVDSPLLGRLESLLFGLNLANDPYVLQLRDELANSGDDGDAAAIRKRLIKVFVSRKTYCSEQIKALYNRAVEVYAEVGGFATDWYVGECVARFEAAARSSAGWGGGGDDDAFWDWTAAEKDYICSLFRSAGLQLHDDGDDTCLSPRYSPKMAALLGVLCAEASRPEFTGIVFVKQRATAASLAHTLASDPSAAPGLRVRAFVGTSASVARRAKIAELALPNPAANGAALADFRAGRANLVVCTSVLEEGIDVSACGAVFCHEPPVNLRAFVQRRGRARRMASSFYAVAPEPGAGVVDEGKWADLEQRMLEAYMDEERRVREAEEREAVDEEVPDRFVVASTEYARFL